ncbi:pantoate--beta-alanine ligase [Corynebacterium uropygiale]|uniref:pantoate--beta-alanine ligase (AMP-forming) n=1 Tax=Corynebacterium uropygiale TaxID=1775911 RepID=A0A9X1U7W7_9CORY|nr:pantoate--beta-alanine ligase [Corynebacterium uropygiale]
MSENENPNAFRPGELNRYSSLTEVAKLSHAIRSTGRPVVLVPLGLPCHAGNIEAVRAAASLPRALVIAALWRGLDDDSSDSAIEDAAQALSRAGVEVLLSAPAREPRTEVHSPLEGVGRSQLTALARLVLGSGCTDLVLGERDYRLLIAAQAMITDLAIPVTLHAIPVIRDRDGLPFSTTLMGLDPAEREAAVALSAALTAGAFVASEGADAVLRTVEETVEAAPGVELCSLLLLDPMLGPLAEGATEGRLLAEVELSASGERVEDSVGILLMDREREIARTALEAAGLDPEISDEEWAELRSLQGRVRAAKAEREEREGR